MVLINIMYICSYMCIFIPDFLSLKWPRNIAVVKFLVWSERWSGIVGVNYTDIIF